MTAADCVFCAIVARTEPAEIVGESERALAFMDINPATDEHTLVISNAHAADIWDLEDDDGIAVWSLAHHVSTAIQAGLQPHGLTLFQANQKAGWQDVPHFHLHLVPRWRGDDLVKPWEPSPARRAGIAEAAAKIRAAHSS